MRFISHTLLLAFVCLTTALLGKDGARELDSITIVDQHGFSETYTTKERLKIYNQVNFLQRQPYQKVVRHYGADDNGRARTFATTYYPNGQPKQYLEVLDGRAFGRYQEWHDQGGTRLIVRVVGGKADVDDEALLTFLFDGIAQVFDSGGKRHAEIPYAQGKLHGESVYYYPSGAVAHRAAYEEGLRQGKASIFYENGALKAETQYQSGSPHGPARGFWEDGRPAYVENFVEGFLEWGEYYTLSGTLLAQVKHGNGSRAFFHDDGSFELQSQIGGLPEGVVQEFDRLGQLTREYSIKNGEREGQEVLYHTAPVFSAGEEQPKPKLSVNWYQGEIQGPAKTWYSDGTLESCREMAHNRRNGVTTAWYADGSLMLIEEYADDKLIKGNYFARGNGRPVSSVSDGEGIVTLFDPRGGLLEKIEYYQGSPSVE